MCLGTVANEQNIQSITCTYVYLYITFVLFAQQIVYNGQVNNEIQFVLSEFIV